MKTIHKFPLAIEGTQEITMPVGASVLTAGVDPNGIVCLWAEVNTDEEKTETRVFALFGTGHPVTHKQGHQLFYIGTVVERNRPLVWHIYEEEL